MDMNSVKYFFIFLAAAAQTGLLIWGMRLIADVLKQKDENGTAFVVRALCEKSGARSNRLDQDLEKNDAARNEESQGATHAPGSFSRVAGTVGSIILAASFAGISYWILFQLFDEPSKIKFDGLGKYFLVASALYAPYAFNKISSIFR